MKDTYFQPKKTIRLGDKLMDLSTPKVMGILNITPDSFYAESRVNEISSAVEKANQMLSEGADILDIGGYSSRPGSTDISEEEEIHRIVPVIASIIKNQPDAILSVDTFRSKVAEAAIKEGAKIINDISGGQLDKKLVQVVAKHKIPLVIMHMRGTPQTMSGLNKYNNLFNEVIHEISERISFALNAGVDDIIIDPGFGFSKDLNQNYELLEHLESFGILPFPLLVGVSRKSMIYKKLGISPQDSLNGTIALNTLAISKGANILRVHDVKEAVELVKLLS